MEPATIQTPRLNVDERACIINKVTGIDVLKLGCVSAEFLPRFPSQIWSSDVTFVTFFGDEKCDVSHLSHSGKNVTLSHTKSNFLTCDVFCHILPKKHVSPV